MKKLFTFILATLLAITCLFIVGCGNSNRTYTLHHGLYTLTSIERDNCTITGDFSIEGLKTVSIEFCEDGTFNYMQISFAKKTNPDDLEVRTISGTFVDNNGKIEFEEDLIPDLETAEIIDLNKICLTFKNSKLIFSKTTSYKLTSVIDGNTIFTGNVSIIGYANGLIELDESNKSFTYIIINSTNENTLTARVSEGTYEIKALDNNKQVIIFTSESGENINQAEIVLYNNNNIFKITTIDNDMRLVFNKI